MKHVYGILFALSVYLTLGAFGVGSNEVNDLTISLGVEQSSAQHVSRIASMGITVVFFFLYWNSLKRES